LHIPFCLQFFFLPACTVHIPPYLLVFIRPACIFLPVCCPAFLLSSYSALLQSFIPPACIFFPVCCPAFFLSSYSALLQSFIPPACIFLPVCCPPFFLSCLSLSFLSSPRSQILFHKLTSILKVINCHVPQREEPGDVGWECGIDYLWRNKGYATSLPLPCFVIPWLSQMRSTDQYHFPISCLSIMNHRDLYYC
jgi:hypothetical protein